MAIKSEYLQSVYNEVITLDGEQHEFLQAVREVLESVEPVVELSLIHI